MLCDSIYTKCLEQASPQRKQAECGCQALGAGGLGVTDTGGRVFLWGEDETVLEPDRADDCPISQAYQNLLNCTLSNLLK